MPRLEELLGIDLPIIQAPMAGAQGSALAIAVANAGGMGSVPCAMLSIDSMRTELASIRAATDKPINVNFFCHHEPVTNESALSKWRKRLAPYYKELGLEIDGQSAGVGGGHRKPFNREAAEAIGEFKPEVVSFHFGLPAPELLSLVGQWGPKIISSATTVEEAQWLEAHGADIIVAQGLEAGGHRGHFLSADLTMQPGTFALLPQMVKAVAVPVVAAGGIADAKGVAAALDLGAAGVQIGTAYLLCTESTITPLHRSALKSEAARHTAVTNVITGRPARGIVNRIMRELGPIDADTPEFPLAYNDVAPLRAKAEANGSSDFSPLWCGQNASGCREIAAADLTRELAG
ncbi:MAG: NAD(P)H-dependent flavin oxidoreductase [Chthoniobacterales bacterium]